MKRPLFKAAAFVAALVAGTWLHAAPPPNDNLANAQQLTGDFGALIADTTDATYEEGESSLVTYGVETNTVWYKWSAPAKTTKPFMFSVRQFDDDIYVSYRIRVYTGTSYDDLAPVESSPCGWGFCAEPGKTYLIRLSTYNKPGKVAVLWRRELAEGEWKIFAADGVVFDTDGDLPKDLKVSDFPAGVTRIAKYAFEDVEGMKFVTIPATVTKIDDYAFGWASDLAWVDYEGDAGAIEVADTAYFGTPYSLELPFKLIFDEGVVTNFVPSADHTTVTTNFEKYCIVESFVGTCPDELVISEGVTGVYEGAFDRMGNETLVKVTFPSTLKWINEYAFDGCDALEQVAGIPATAEVSDWAFTGSLYEKVRPFKLVTSEKATWVKDPDLGTYKYTTNTWVNGFHGTCPEDVTIPEGIYGIDEDAFSFYGNDYGNLRSVTNLKKVTLPSSLKEIDWNAFSYLPNLEEVVFKGEKAGVSTGYGAFAGTPYLQNLPFELNTTYYVIDATTSNLWVTGYSGYKAPETIVIPDGVYGIQWGAFRGLEGFSAVTIPASVKRIDEYAFADCEDLATVTFRGSQDEMNIADNAFLGTPYSATLPFKLLSDSWEDDGYWMDLYDEYGNLTNDVWVTWDAPKTIWEVYGYVGTCPAKLDLTQYLTGSVGVVYFYDDAFAGATTLTELVLPKADCYNSSRAFHKCLNLAKVTISGDAASDKAWLTSNFQGTPWLDTVVPFEFVTKDNVHTNPVITVVEESNCCKPYNELKRVTNDVVTIEKWIVGFYGNVPAKLTFPDDVYGIDSYVFSFCDNITEVVVPGNVRTVGDGAFQSCDNLQNVEFEEGVEYIGGEMFYGCGNDMQVILPASAVFGHYVPNEVNPSEDDFQWRGVAMKWRSGCFDYSYVFYGIVGDVDVVAPRTTSIYDRAFQSGTSFGRTCVEYYTHVVLDAAGGTLEGEADYRCFDDVVTGLPTPVLAGNVFREWWDEDGSFYRNGDVWDEDAGQVYLKAAWAGEKKYTVYGLNGPTEFSLGEGDDYETLLRVLADMFGAEPQPSRHGLTFRYWMVDGVQLNHRSEIGANSTFGAFFDEFNPLLNNPEAAIDTTAAQVYDGYILDYKGNCAGTVQVKVGKPNKKTGEAKVSATAQMFGEKKVTFKAEPKGSWKIETGAATKGVTLFSAKAKDKIVIDISEKGIFGTFGDYDVIGSRNTSKKDADAAYASWSGRKYDVAFKTKEGTGSAFTGGYSGVTVSIANKGKVKITGVMADGAKVNATAQLLIADSGEGMRSCRCTRARRAASASCSGSPLTARRRASNPSAHGRVRTARRRSPPNSSLSARRLLRRLPR